METWQTKHISGRAEITTAKAKELADRAVLQNLSGQGEDGRLPIFAPDYCSWQRDHKIVVSHRADIFPGDQEINYEAHSHVGAF